MKKVIAFLCIVFCLFTSCYSGAKYQIVEIKTSYGNIYIWLYEDTPKHRENFLKLTKQGFYDQTQFHRIIKNFMIQGGDPNSKDVTKKEQWGLGGTNYTIPSEFKLNHHHKKGALAAARMGDNENPKKESSGCQFYIVQGNIFTHENLSALESQMGVLTGDPHFKFTDQARADYTSIGGTPHLDMQYTVFGEVIAGLDVVDKIASLTTGAFDRPVAECKIDINIIELTEKKIKKKFKFLIPKK